VTVTNIDSVRPELQSSHYQFLSEDEAHMFIAWAREDLDAHEDYHFVDSEVYLTEDEVSGELVVWTARVDYIHTDRTPNTPEAA